MPETTFLKFKDENGVTAGGHLEPLDNIGLAIPVPVLIPDPVTKIPTPGEAAAEVHIYPAETLDDFTHARIVPGTRIVEIGDSRIVSALLYTQKWEQVDPPTRADITSAATVTADAAAEAGTHTDPDDTDNQAGDGQED